MIYYSFCGMRSETDKDIYGSFCGMLSTADNDIYYRDVGVGVCDPLQLMPDAVIGGEKWKKMIEQSF